MQKSWPRARKMNEHTAFNKLPDEAKILVTEIVKLRFKLSDDITEYGGDIFDAVECLSIGYALAIPRINDLEVKLDKFEEDQDKIIHKIRGDSQRVIAENTNQFIKDMEAKDEIIRTLTEENMKQKRSSL
jgi:hypothetical protein